MFNGMTLSASKSACACKAVLSSKKTVLSYTDASNYFPDELNPTFLQVRTSAHGGTQE
jgi:hypothetical protein